MRKILVTALLAWTMGVAWAQDVAVHGRVVDNAGQPLPGVNIVVDGTTIGTVTDMDGNYTISAPRGASLVYTFIGYNENRVEMEDGRNVRGVSGVQVEQVSGLPQIQVRYNHNRMAAYGVSVDDVNRILETTFAGATAGAIYEGEKKFDVVVRLDNRNRTVEELRQLAIPVGEGITVPLEQLADIVNEPAPSQVSHENGDRRIYVGFNIKGRDMQSTVEEIETLMNEKVQLPEGYYYTYGGENIK